MSDEKDEPVNPSELVSVKLNFRIPSRMPAVYAHHMLIQQGEHEITLSFFEVLPPLVTSDIEDSAKFLQEVGLTAECVARVTIAKDRYPSFVKAMQQTLGQISSQQQEEQTNADAGGNNQKS